MIANQTDVRQPFEVIPATLSFTDAARNGMVFYSGLQLDDGHRGSSYAGPCFTLPGIVFALYITNGEIPEEWTIDMTKWICCQQNDAGGWGLHFHGKSSLFPTVLYYVTLRILSMQPTNTVTVRARYRIHEFGKSRGD